MFCVILQKIIKVFVRMYVGWPSSSGSEVSENTIGLDSMRNGGSNGVLTNVLAWFTTSGTGVFCSVIRRKELFFAVI